MLPPFLSLRERGALFLPGRSRSVSIYKFAGVQGCKSGQVKKGRFFASFVSIRSGRSVDQSTKLGSVVDNFEVFDSLDIISPP